MVGRVALRLIACVLALVGCVACNRDSAPDASETAPPSAASTEPGAVASTQVKAATAKAPVSKRPSAPPPAEIWKEFSGDKAFAEVRRQVELGPRPAGSSELEKARVFIEESLRRSGWEVERQPFTNETPRGPVQFINLIARFSVNGAHPVPRNTQQAIVCSHYDTKRFSTIRFVGASDGASSTGALLELARVLALDPALAAKIELVFFDGEEAFVQFTEIDDPKPDGLFGSRYYARQLRESKRAAQFRFGVLWDMIGDRNLTITLSPDSPPELARDILAAAEAQKLREYFGYYERPISDDHVPLTRLARIPTIDLIDFDYPAWHTADDNLDHIAPESLQKIGVVTLYYLRKTLGK